MLRLAEEALGIAQPQIVQVQVAGVQLVVDVEDPPAPGLDETPVGVQATLAVDGAERLHTTTVPGHEHVEAGRPFDQRLAPGAG